MKIYLKLSSGRFAAYLKEKKRSRLYGLLGLALLAVNILLIGYQLANQISYRQKIRQNHTQISLLDDKIKVYESKISKERINLLSRRVTFYNQVVQEDTFPWMPILYQIETSLIPNVTLTSLKPSFTESRITVEGLSTSNITVAEFISRLERIPDFGEVYPLRQSMEIKGKPEEAGRRFIKFALVIYYQPPAAGAVGASSSAAKTGKAKKGPQTKDAT